MKKSHADAGEDKALFNKMMKKAVKPHKIKTHLKEDIKESKKSIKKDKSLIKSMKYSKKK